MVLIYMQYVFMEDCEWDVYKKLLYKLRKTNSQHQLTPNKGINFFFIRIYFIKISLSQCKVCKLCTTKEVNVYVDINILHFRCAYIFTDQNLITFIYIQCALASKKTISK